MTAFRLALVLLALLYSAHATAQAGTPLRRFALTVAANDGGPAREHLLFAERDARAIDARAASFDLGFAACSAARWRVSAPATSSPQPEGTQVPPSR